MPASAPLPGDVSSLLQAPRSAERTTQEPARTAKVRIAILRVYTRDQASSRRTNGVQLRMLSRLEMGLFHEASPAQLRGHRGM